MDKNRKKNRYANIVTYDHSRVKLAIQDDDPRSDYINASFIDGYSHLKKYIASQGPNEASTADFWRMIWEQNCSKVVMVTNVIEGGKIKSGKYWPDKADTYGSITVTLTEKDVHSNYTIRYFSVNDATLDGSQNREVCQFHYTTWPDMDVPENASALLDFIHVVTDYRSEDLNPTVVHCSAGVGRTGTFITIESMMRQGKQEGQIDIFKFVSDMRKSRMHMIQTEDQYEFIFDALLVHFVFGDTSIPVDVFRDTYDKLKARNHKTNSSGLAVQFQNLQDISIFPTIKQCSAAASKENISKNRFEDVLAADKTRPYLMSEGEDGDKHATNYINATFIHGFRTRDAFLTTQMPMPNTRCDMWRMVYDYNCSTIVMLNPLDANDQTLAPYWPIKGATSFFGPFTVECVSKKKTDEEIVTRILKVKKTTSKEERTVVHFTLKNWSNDSKQLPGKTSVGTLAMMVVDQMKKDASDNRVCVHCIDGMGVSGTFVAITTALHRLNDEQTVDIFQTVKRVRMCNARAVKTKRQYRFIYDVVQDSLLSGQVYENYVAP